MFKWTHCWFLIPQQKDKNGLLGISNDNDLWKQHTKRHEKLVCSALNYLPFLCVISHTVEIKRSKHLNTQNSIEQKKKQQEDGNTPDLLPRPPANESRQRCHIFAWQLSIICADSKNAHNNIVLQNVSDAGAREFETEVNPEGPDHNERSGDSQHSPWRHLIDKLCYFKHL